MNKIGLLRIVNEEFTGTEEFKALSVEEKQLVRCMIEAENIDFDSNEVWLCGMTCYIEPSRLTEALIGFGEKTFYYTKKSTDTTEFIYDMMKIGWSIDKVEQVSVQYDTGFERSIYKSLHFKFG